MARRKHFFTESQQARARTKPAMKRRAKLQHTEAETIFLAVASATLDRIRRDREAAPQRLRPMLTYIERNLFTRGLTASRMYDACGIRDRSMSTFFARALSLTPWRYIEACRVEIGERLLRETEIKVTWIYGFLGYASLKVFANAFGRLTNERPLAYRKRCQAEALLQDAAWPSDRLARVIKLQRALNGSLPPDEARPMIAQLIALYPDPHEQEGQELRSSAFERVLHKVF